MTDLDELLRNNRDWAERVRQEDPQFFERLSQQQAPKYLWIGCSDSRVPANQIMGLAPGEVFVHRNIANVMVHTDLNCMSVIQFAVDVLRIEHILVVGHYGCGGVLAALNGTRVGLADNWIRHVADVAGKHQGVLEAMGDALHAVLDVTINRIGEHPMAGRAAAGFDARTTLKRSDFGINKYVPNVSDDIVIAITSEAMVPKPEASAASAAAMK